MSPLFSIAIVSLVAASVELIELPRWSPFKRQSIEDSLFPSSANRTGGELRTAGQCHGSLNTLATGAHLVGGGADVAMTGPAASASGSSTVPLHAAAYLSL